MYGEPIFIWERKQEYITIYDDLKYLFYFRGCFCPPHKGHFLTIQRYLKYPNVKVIIHQIGGERHGVSKNMNRRTWQYYIKELLPEDRVDLVQYNSSTKNLPKGHSFFKDTDVLVMLRGDETSNVREQEKLELSTKQSLISKCLKYETQLIFLYEKRDHDKLSASSFIKNLIQYRKGKYRLIDLYQYLPEMLPVDIKNKIINKLLRYPLR